MPLESLLNNNAPPRRSETAPVAVTLEQLRDSKERTALLWLYIFAVPVWLALGLWIVLGYGIPLVLIGIIWLLHAAGQMWHAAHLKANAVRVSEWQLPELNAAVDACCQKLGMERPDVYVLQQNVWNAFATKIFGTRMVVLFSGAVDSILLKGDLKQLMWVVGHELGHHWAGHLNTSQKLAKMGGWMIWVGLWHSRRAELTCDRVGLFCTGSIKASQLALVNLTVGAQLANRVNIEAAAQQWQSHQPRVLCEIPDFL